MLCRTGKHGSVACLIWGKATDAADRADVLLTGNERVEIGEYCTGTESEVD